MRVFPARVIITLVKLEDGRTRGATMADGTIELMQSLAVYAVLWPIIGMFVVLAGGSVADFIRLPTTQGYQKFVAVLVLGAATWTVYSL